MTNKIHILDQVGLDNAVLQHGLILLNHVFEYHSPLECKHFLEETLHSDSLSDSKFLLLVDPFTFHRAKRLVPFQLEKNIAIVVIASHHELETEFDCTEVLGSNEVIDVVEAPISPNSFSIILRRAELHFQNQHRFDLLSLDSLEQRNELKKLNDLGIALSVEQDVVKLLDMILTVSMEFTNADAGSMYIVEDKQGVQPDPTNYFTNKQFRFKHAKNFSREVPFKEMTFPITRNSIAGYTALSAETLNLPDVYFIPQGSEFSFGGRGFDSAINYRTKSMLVVPMLNHQKEVIGVIQLINKKKDASLKLNTPEEADSIVIPFTRKDERLISSLASQAAVTLENQILFESHKILLESFIRLIAEAIDKKSAYTGGHCNRVPILTEMLAKAAVESTSEPFKEFSLTSEQWYELHIAAWLHDCGKVVTPVHVMDKATKLETIYDRINTVKARFEVLKRDAQIDYLTALQRNGKSHDQIDAEYQATLKSIEEDSKFIEEVNIGGEFLSDEKIARIKSIGARKIKMNGTETTLLTEEEVYNLSIRRGTLSNEERKIINDHIVVTIEMLEKLPFPRNLLRVPEYAGGHHEKMDGTGYPKGLTKDQMSIPARIMAIADVFEALTAVDRPYKKGKTLSESMNIMAKMKEEHHLDPELLDLFVTSGVYKEYAKKFMQPELIDEVDETRILNAKPKPSNGEAKRPAMAH
ncbi:MAG: HD domain-containing phosphohydrolase [Chloroherpetonaceae bacterium]|nr:HD domain-containing phosphohydrolase [Chloroherpetonaceae bacterium]